MNVVLRLTEAVVEFLWVGGGWWGVCKVIFVSNPTTVEVVLRLSWGFDNYHRVGIF